MKRKSRIATSLICGVVCAACVFAYTQSVRGEAEAARAEALQRYGGDQVEVVVAVHDIAPGKAIGSGDVQVKLWVADLLPEGAVRSLDGVVGRSASTSILAGEVVSSRRFESETSLLDVPDSMTAVTLPAKDVQAVGGAIVPGMEVDVYTVGNTATRLIGQRMQVLATSTSGHNGSETVAWITLAVPPDKAQEMVAAAANNQVYFTLPGAAVTK